MSFDDMATDTILTKRGVEQESGRYQTPTTYLTNVKILPIMPVESSSAEGVNIRDGVPFQAMTLLQFYTEKHSHTKSGNAVDEVPDITEGDIVVDGSTEYHVNSVQSWPTTSLTPFLEVFIEEPH